MRYRFAALAAALVMLAACQSSKQAGSAAPPTVEPAAAIAAEPVDQSAAAAQTAFAAPVIPSPAQCAIAIAGGPPPKPSKGADFGSAAAKNVGKGIGRSFISTIGSSIAGPLGGAVAGGVATSTIRSEQDLKGTWTATDGAPTCGCAIDVSAATNLQLKTANKGKLAPRNCGNPLLARASRWTLGHSFTGYDAPFELLAADGASLAKLNRDGVNYFFGALADCTPVTLWRD